MESVSKVFTHKHTQDSGIAIRRGRERFKLNSNKRNGIETEVLSQWILTGAPATVCPAAISCTGDCDLFGRVAGQTPVGTPGAFDTVIS